MRIKVNYGGSNTQKSLNYAGVKVDNQARLIWKQHLLHSGPEEIFKEMQMIQRTNPRIRDSLAFLKISPSPLDKIDDQLAKKICEEVCHGMGHEESQSVAWEHNDTLVTHYHLICNRIQLTRDRKVVDNYFSGLRADKLAEMLEQKYSLIRAKEQENKYVKIIADVLQENESASDIKEQLLKFDIEVRFDEERKRFKYFRKKSNGASFGTRSFKFIDSNTLKKKLSYEQYNQSQQSSNKKNTRSSLNRNSEVDQNNTKSRTSNTDKSEGNSVDF